MRLYRSVRTRKRLLKLADLLRKDARRRKGVQFNMGTWGCVQNPKKPLSCGTQACAFGLAALSQEFKGLNYRLNPMKELIFTWKGKDVTDPTWAAAQCFEIAHRDATDLFMSGLSLSEAEGERLMAKRIEHYAKTGEVLDVLTLKGCSFN